MKEVLYFIGRLAFALLFLIGLAVTILIASHIVFKSDGSFDSAAKAVNTTFSVIITLAPIILIACFTHSSPKKIRFLAALKATVVMVGLYTIYNKYVGPWLGELFQDISSNGMGYSFFSDTFLTVFLMFYAGVLTVHWIPSLQAKAVGPPPKNVKYFEKIMALVLGVSFLSTMINYDRLVIILSGYDTNLWLTEELAGYYVIANLTSTFLITVYLIWSIARAGSKAMRTVLFGFYIVGIIMNSFSIVHLIKLDYLILASAIVLVVLQGLALYYVYTPEANRWFDGGAEPSEQAS